MSDAFSLAVATNTLLPFTTTLQTQTGKDITVEWRWESPRQRTVLVRKTLFRADSPGIAFALPRDPSRRAYLSLYAFVSPTRPEQPDHATIEPRFGHGWACLGYRAMREIKDGALDPVVAYWMTGFRDVPWWHGVLGFPRHEMVSPISITAECIARSQGLLLFTA